MPDMNYRSVHIADSSYKVSNRCVFVPLLPLWKCPVMLSRIIVVVWPEIDLTLCKLGWYSFPPHASPLKWSTEETWVSSPLWHRAMRGEAHRLKCGVKVSLRLEDTTCIYDIPPGYIHAFCRCDLWGWGVVCLRSQQQSEGEIC